MTAKSDEFHGKVEVKAAPKVRLVNGRIVGKSIADPDVQDKLTTPEQTRAGLTLFYVKQGILTADGKLSKRFGGGR